MTDQWSNTWQKPTNPLDALSRDEVLVRWQELQQALARAKEAEMEMRKYVVSRAFPDPKEGMNTLELGNGYELKAGVKFNYNLVDNVNVEAILAKIETIGNSGKFVAERLVSWTPHFLLTEYRQLQADAETGSEEAKAILSEVNKMIVITDAAPTLTIKEPKAKK